MNFTRFPASTTNIFPIVNSTTGGQLLTEFNLRSRESIITDENIKYIIGQSFTHSQDDFIVRALEDELGTRISSTELEITPGRALVNGHYLESLTSVVIDLAEANNYLKSNNQIPLKGKLAIGLRAMYSTEQTLSASMVKEDGDNMMAGLQFVILPIGKIEAGYFVLPSDSPDNENLVTAHLKLAEFYYNAGTITSIVQNENKTQAIQASRISDVDKLMAGSYVTRKGLNPKKLYTFSGKSYDKNSSKDTWCDSTDSLFIWQKASDLKLTEDKPNEQAEFGYDAKQNVTLTLPHKVVDGGMFNTEGKEVFYNSRVMNLPKASYSGNTPGTVDSSYTKSIKAINEKIFELYNLPNGKQRKFIDIIEDESRSELPTINQTYWNCGDYILVRVDNSVVAGSDALQSPTTFYVVIPPKVEEVEYFATRLDDLIPANFDGVEISKFVEDSLFDSEEEYVDIYTQISESIKGGSEGKAQYNEDLGVSDSNYRGVKEDDYILRTYTNVPTPSSIVNSLDPLQAFKELVDAIIAKEEELDKLTNGELIESVYEFDSEHHMTEVVTEQTPSLEDLYDDYRTKADIYNDLIKQLEDLEKQIREIDRAVGGLNNTLISYQTNLHNNTLQIQALNEQIAKDEKDASAAKKIYMQCKTDKPKLEKDVEDKRIYYQRMKSAGTSKQIKKAYQDLIDAKNAVKQNNKDYEANYLKYKKLRGNVKTNSSKVTALETENSKLLVSIEQTQTKIEEAIAAYTGDNGQTLQDLNNDHKSLQDQAAEAAETRNNAYTVWNTRNSAVNRVDSELKELKGQSGVAYRSISKTWNVYYKVTKDDGEKIYSEPNMVTGSIPIATTETLGGFYNVEDSYLDSGYIHLNEQGHLKLLDYDLLRTGVLAYQLGQDRELNEGLTSEEIQVELDEYINERVCFPNPEHLSNGKYPDMIEVTIHLSEETIFSKISISNIDSRFGCGLWVHLVGDCSELTTVNFSNCEKLRIDITGCHPVVNIHNCGLYYDPEIIEYINLCPRVYASQAALSKYDEDQIIYANNFTGIDNFSIWYKKFDDDEPNLIVDGMTVTETETPIIPDDIDYWSELVDNDNHYFFGLQSISFAPNGTISGCGLYLRNDMTANVQLTKTVSIAKFVLPQGNNFTYPKSSLRRQVKITGDFVTAYPSSAPEGYIVMTTKFTALSQNYTSYENLGNEPLAEDDATGTISFLNDAMLIENYIGVDEPIPVDGWESNSYHVFRGWTIG